MSRELKVQQINPKVFKKYGKLIVLKPNQEPLADNENLTYWEKVVEYEPGINRTIGLLTEKKRKMELTQMERHVKALEFFIPVDGQCVACFAEPVNPDDPDETPDPNKVVAFEMKGLVGFVVNRGVWHWPAFPLTETATQLVNLRRNTEHDDVEVKDLPEPMIIKK